MYVDGVSPGCLCGLLESSFKAWRYFLLNSLVSVDLALEENLQESPVDFLLSTLRTHRVKQH